MYGFLFSADMWHPLYLLLQCFCLSFWYIPRCVDGVDGWRRNKTVWLGRLLAMELQNFWLMLPHGYMVLPFLALQAISRGTEALINCPQKWHIVDVCILEAMPQ